MKTAILFVSKYGTVAKCAGLLKEKLKGDVQLFDLQHNKGKIDLEAFDTIAIGGSIHAGRLQARVIKFCANRKTLLLAKKTGLFLCTLSPYDQADHYYAENLPADLLAGVKARACFGGELDFTKMNFFERYILKKIAGTDKNVSHIALQEIDRFAQALM